LVEERIWLTYFPPISIFFREVYRLDFNQSLFEFWSKYFAFSFRFCWAKWLRERL